MKIKFAQNKLVTWFATVLLVLVMPIMGVAAEVQRSMVGIVNQSQSNTVKSKSGDNSINCPFLERGTDTQSLIKSLSNPWVCNGDTATIVAIYQSKPKLLLLVAILVGECLVYVIKMVLDAAGLTADPPRDVIIDDPLPLPPGHPPRGTRPPPPPNRQNQNIRIANEVVSDPLVIGVGESGRLVGTAIFAADDLNNLYGSTSYLDPNGNPYLICETYILQSAPNANGPWKNVIQAYVYQNKQYCCAATYKLTSTPIESILIDRYIETETKTFSLKSFINEMKILPNKSEFFRTAAGVPTWDSPDFMGCYTNW